MGHNSEVPADHPRAGSLRTRQRLVDGVESGLTSRHGLIAHGRGEAFDYLLGEETIPSADRACRAAAAYLHRADHPVISVNGNVAALSPEAVIDLAQSVDAVIEVNLFHRNSDRVQAITDHLRDHGAEDVLGPNPDETIPGLAHDRAHVHADGIYAADVVVIPLEDGDRAEALAAMGKDEIVIDLNPLSRSMVAATVPICDNLIRALPCIADHARDLASSSDGDLDRIIDKFDAIEAREDAESVIRSGPLT